MVGKKTFKKKQGRKGGGRKPRFQYRERSQEQWRKERNRSTGDYDKAYKDEFTVFKAREGDNRIRVLPPTFKEAEHFAIVIWLHSNIGPDNQTYLCHSKLEAMGGEGKCPICDEYALARRSGDDDYAKEIKPYSKMLAWIIDRNDPDKGPQLWAIPATVHRDILGNSEDPDTKEILVIDHHEHGYDIVFKREGSGLKTKYPNVRPSPRSTPLSDDARTQNEWLDFIMANPLDTVLNFYDTEYISGVFSGSTSSEVDSEDTGEDEESTDYDEQDGDIDDPNESLDGPDEEEPEEEELEIEMEEGDKVAVEIEGSKYNGTITDTNSEAATIKFEDDDILEIPWEEVELVKKAVKKKTSKKTGKKKTSKIRQRVRERLGG